MFTMTFKRFKKYITLMLCAAVFNACVVPSADLLAARRPIFKKSTFTPTFVKARSTDKSADRSADKTANKTTEETPPKKATMQETWQKVYNFEFKSLNKADAWNIGKATVGALSACVLAYILFNSKPAAGDNPDVRPAPDLPDDQPTIIIPEALQDIMNDDQYGPEHKQKIKDICRDDYNKQLEAKNFPNLQDDLVKAINETSTPNPEFIKDLINGRYNDLQKHIENKNIINAAPDADKNKTNTDKDKIKKPTVEPKTLAELYPHAMQATRQNIPVVRQRGASCGYHGVLNSIMSIQGIHENQANDLINAKFTQKNGTWRAPMIQNRKKALVKNYIENTVHKCMLLSTKEEQTAWNTAKAEWNDAGWWHKFWNNAPKKPVRRLNAHERRALGRIANAYAHAFVLNENLNILRENPADLENQLQEIIRQDRPHISAEEVQNISQYIQTIDFTELPIEIAHANTLVEQARTYAYGSNLETDLYGDNLNTAELETLKTIALQEYGINDDVITIIDDTSLLNTQAYQDILNPAREQMLETNCRHAFCMRTSRNTNYNEREVEQLMKTINDANATKEAKDKAELRQRAINSTLSADTGATHWISVTLNRVNGQNTYCAKDSMGRDYTEQHNFLQLIEALEKPAIPQPIEIIEQPENKNDTDTTTDDQAFAKALAADITSKLKEQNAMTKEQTVITDKDTTNTNAEKEVIVQPKPSSNPQKLASIPTLAQIGNSCAHHALKNANDILRMLQKAEIFEMQNDFEAIATRISKSLCSDASKAKIIALFDEKNCSGEWRELIRPGRLPEALKESIYDKLLRSVPLNDEQTTLYNEQMAQYQLDKSNWDERQKNHDYLEKDPMPQKPKLPYSTLIDTILVRPTSTSTVKNYLSNIANACTTQLTNTDNTIILREDVRLEEILMDVMREHAPSSLQNDEENYNQCITFLSPAELRKNFGEEITIQTATKGNNPQARKLLGNDLSDEELQHLLDNGNVEHARNISIIARIETSEFVAGNSYALSDALPLVKTKMMNDSCSHAFLLRSGLVNVEDGAAHQGTHWICVVLYRVNGQNHYIIADSLANKKSDSKTTLLNKNDRTNDDDVTFLIGQLEA